MSKIRTKYNMEELKLKYTETREEYISRIQSNLTFKTKEKFKKYRAHGKYKRFFEDKSLVLGIDYQECPITGHRNLSIIGSYIKALDGLTSNEEYYFYIPENNIILDIKRNAIRKGIHELYVDESGKHILGEDGNPITKHQYSILASKETKLEVGEDGLNTNQRVGLKTAASHLENVDFFGRNGYQQQKLAQFLNGNGVKSTAEKRLFDNYKETIANITYKSKLLEDFKGDTETFLTRDSSNIYEDMQIDHIYSQREGYDMRESPFLIAHEANCQHLTIIANTIKKKSSDISIEELYESTGYTKERSNYEFDLFIESVNKSYEVGGGFFLMFILEHMYTIYSLEQYKPEFLELIRSINHSDGTRYKK